MHLLPFEMGLVCERLGMTLGGIYGFCTITMRSEDIFTHIDRERNIWAQLNPLPSEHTPPFDVSKLLPTT